MTLGEYEMTRDEAEIERWSRAYPDALETAIDTTYAPALAINLNDPSAVHEIIGLVRRFVLSGNIIIRKSAGHAQALILFQTETPFAGCCIDCGAGQTIELFGIGEQVIAEGTNPKKWPALLLGRRLAMDRRSQANAKAYRSDREGDPARDRCASAQGECLRDRPG
jgi:hypothetical protein